ncbi:MAG: alkylhydroperoxidase [Lysobacterales bacterium CG17_big_fil_post_rev_8_21_14_2_50_64_11]|nr:MAG: alkylhydroperoxidase [Xanthomonadales bacterium CG17_big_fil_post_rev_8_21_14_2_50_64_11]PIX59794.1 MAG: alkylhydroperoxidase [Xanthomonadales bacterium CG_4_10_14_3_um_filter_64_11]
MSWIESVAPAQASGRLKTQYDRLLSGGGQLDNIITVHGLRPHTLEGHLALYRAALHHSANTLPKAYLEAVGVWVSALNGCTYCVAHHRAGLLREAADVATGEAMLAALEGAVPGSPFTVSEQAGLAYAGKLALTPVAVTAADIEAMRLAGLDDGQILEINQVTGYFCYANRVVLGLGVTLDGEALGHAHG